MREFKVNHLITLRLINGKTVLFVNNREFKQCKILLLNVPKNEELTEEIKSIDEAAHYFGSNYIYGYIEKEEEFWAHCSNLQAWVENNYNTDILHRNLAFPLLEILSKEGDKIAKQRLREEIARRYKCGGQNVQIYLFREKYLDYLTNDDMLSGIFIPEEASFMAKIFESGSKYRLIPKFGLLDGQIRDNTKYISLKNGRINELEFEIKSNLLRVPSEIESLKTLELLHIYIGSHSDNIFGEQFNAESITDLMISCNAMDITIPDLLYYFPNLRWLYIEGIKINGPVIKYDESSKKSRFLIEGIDYKPIVRLENSFKKLQNLESIKLHNVSLDELPDTIVNLKKLIYVDLAYTSIKSLSVPTIETLKRTGTLTNSNLILLPEEFKALKKIN
ncbi:hypothetical protein LCGC14_1240450 [marine sediment metagenome]|uniref:Leucine-rich repeat domain-containing protein n=1 Tax=marine sediment metagenome TaxID=412755 RepID=A0A0F9PA98_9ZZZZ